jgi:ribosomal protein S18 acetylase RimI-like enzyme
MTAQTLGRAVPLHGVRTEDPATRISAVTDGIGLRRAGIDDVDTLMEIQFRSPSREAVAMAGSAAAAQRFGAMLLSRALANGTTDVILVEVDGTVAGFAQVSTGGDVPPLRIVARCAVQAMGVRGALVAGRRALARAAVDLTSSEEGLHLVELQIDPDRRNQGLGSRLLAEVERVALERGASTLSLTTQIDNPARRLYARSGFQVHAEKRHRRYEAITGSPGRVLMVKTLTA